MEGEAGKPSVDSFRSSVPLGGAPGNPTPFHRDQGELAGDEESVDDQQERDECQTGGRTNGEGPRRSREANSLTPAKSVRAGPYLVGQEVKMLIDCEQCAMRDTSACDDCVVTCLLGGGPVDLSETQVEAMANLADEGLVPKLRLVPAERRVS